MSEFSYKKGRLNLPFVGFCTFAKAPVCEDWKNIKADVAVLGEIVLACFMATEIADIAHITVTNTALKWKRDRAFFHTPPEIC